MSDEIEVAYTFKGMTRDALVIGVRGACFLLPKDKVHWRGRGDTILVTGDRQTFIDAGLPDPV
jgi:hypothetical protein